MKFPINVHKRMSEPLATDLPLIGPAPLPPLNPIGPPAFIIMPPRNPPLPGLPPGPGWSPSAGPERFPPRPPRGPPPGPPRNPPRIPGCCPGKIQIPNRQN